MQNGTFDLNRVIRGQNEKLARASARGYAGVRGTGDTAWLGKKDSNDFCEYQDSLNRSVAYELLAFAVQNCSRPPEYVPTAGHKCRKVVRTPASLFRPAFQHRVILFILNPAQRTE